MYLVYSLLTAAGMILLSPYFLIKGIRQKKYRHNWRERLGLRFPPELRSDESSTSAAPSTRSGANWVHAVSVGEALAAVPLARSLKERFPERRLVISTTTATGQELVRERLKFADAIFYFPFDWKGPVRRTLREVRPDLVIVCETEIWPNFLREARRAGVQVVFVNGRISPRSFSRYLWALRWSGGLLRGFLRGVLADATLYLMQTDADARRLLALGAPAERVAVTGNMKYDMGSPLPNAMCAWLTAELERSARRPLLVAGSLASGEEKLVLEALAAVEREWPGALLVMAPRKPERFEAAAVCIEQSGRKVVRRSQLLLDGPSCGVLRNNPGEQSSVLLLDTIGELGAIYQLADAVFIGGSIEPMGGHNPLEPAASAKVPIFGPSMDNFREIATALLSADAAIQVRSGSDLGSSWVELLNDPGRSARMGQAALAVVAQNRGATEATLERIASLYSTKQERS